LFGAKGDIFDRFKFFKSFGEMVCFNHNDTVCPTYLYNPHGESKQNWQN
jgi:hypothetical protein